MTLICADAIGARAELGSLLDGSGRVTLSHDPALERVALIVGTMIGDILRQRVRAAGAARADDLLHVHVGTRVTEDAHAPVLLVLPATTTLDTAITLRDAPWSACSPLRFGALGWADSTGGEPVIDSDQGPVCTRVGSVWTLRADVPGIYGREALRHATADGNVPAILASHVVMRALLQRMGVLPDQTARASSLITVDAEDQQRYFINRAGHCSNVRGAPDDDLQFANSCRTIMRRCEEAGLKAVFMVTGDEIDPSFVDAFGDRLIGLEENRRVLDEMTARGHDVACHGFDHEWWMSRGRSAITPMSLWEKLRYFAGTSGDLRTLFGLMRFLWRYGPLLRRARAVSRARARPSGETFQYHEIEQDIERWMQLVGFSGARLFIRYPGYVRTAAAVQYLDDRFATTIDSSDLYQLDDGLPAFPYSILAECGDVLRRTRILEIPCLWIDRLLRTRDAARVAADLERLAALARFPGSVLSFVTHTKVIGSTWGHCHVYLHDPIKGMALPASPDAWREFAAFLREHTRSCNWRDLQGELLGAAA